MAGKDVAELIHVSYLKVNQIFERISFAPGVPLLEVYASLDTGLRSSSKVQNQIKLYGVAETPFSVQAHWEKAYTRLIKGPWPTLRIKREAFPVVWVNPPQNKLSYFVHAGHRHLMPEGVLIFVGTPEHLGRADVEWLARNYPGHKVLRLYYNGPFVFMGKKAQKPVSAAREQVEALWRKMVAPNCDVQDPDYHEPGYKRFEVPAVDGPIEPFEGFYISDEEAREAMAQSPLWEQAGALFKALHKKEENSEAAGQPPTPLHAGHLALMLAAGHLNGLVGEGETAHLIRGRTTKSTYTMVDESDTKKTREFYQIVVSALSPNGAYRELGKGGKN